MIKKFLYRLLLFSLLPLGVVLLLEGYIGWRKDRLFTEAKLDRVYAGKGAAYRWIYQVGRANKILLLGSSSVRLGLNCEMLNALSQDSLAFINLGGDARDPIETYFILKQLDLSGVRAMYYALDPWIFSRNYYRHRKSYLYLDFGLHRAIRYWWEEDRSLFARRYRGLIASWFPQTGGSESIPPIPEGFGSVVLNQEPVNFTDPVYDRFRLDRFGWSDLQFEYFGKIIRLCEQKQILFRAFYVPKSPDFNRDYQSRCRDIQRDFLSRLRSSGLQTPILGSFQQLGPGSDSLFADAYHLNGKGQAHYSDLFFRLTR